MSDQQGPAGYPISVKGVVVRGGRVLLLKMSERNGNFPGAGSKPGRSQSSAWPGKSRKKPPGR